MQGTQFTLCLSCENRPGIVAAVSANLFETGCNILEAQQFDDRATGRFFMRVVFNSVKRAASLAELHAAFAPAADRLQLSWSLRERGAQRRVMILASRYDHCLADLLYRQRVGEMPMDIAAIVSNHPVETYARLDLRDVPFFHIPVTPETKPQAEARLWRTIEDQGIELVVLARYMQVLSDELTARLAGRCINIHHSFLPSFKGAMPYHQAHTRGVKLIGATAHYVTSDLDEGPIIEQDVERVSHGDTPEDLIRKGRDIERRVLARAVRYQLDDRVLLNGRTTVVFSD